MKKTLSFAMMHFTIAFSVAYLLTGNLVVGGLVAIVEPTINTIAFYFHERYWQRHTGSNQVIVMPADQQTISLKPLLQQVSSNYAMK